MRNLEIKVAVDNPRVLERRVAAVPARLASIERQIDTYFQVGIGRLKLRERSRKAPAPAAGLKPSLSLTASRASDGSELIFYRRSEASARRVSNYFLHRVDDAPRLKRFLEVSFGVLVTVVKRRKVYLYENARIHLDSVKGLGQFAEIEVVISRGERQARHLMTELLRRLKIDARDLIRASYSDMLVKKARRRRSPGRRTVQSG